MKKIELIKGSGEMGYEKEAPYDAILYSAAVKSMPGKALGQLKDGGRFVAPVGGFYQSSALQRKRRKDRN